LFFGAITAGKFLLEIEEKWILKDLVINIFTVVQIVTASSLLKRKELNVKRSGTCLQAA
jgi:hypothetical protein